jgi:predicted DNA-binding mobile mystery protein A
MKRNYQQLQIDQISAQVKALSKPSLKQTPAKGWIRSIRDALGMSSYQLAKRLGVSQMTVIDWEQRESKGTITIQSLKKVADALQCDLVYALVPRKPLGRILEDRAIQRAEASVEQIRHSMTLENQGTSSTYKKRAVKETARQLLEGNSRRLWDS